jgi:hypothetical protein
VASVITARATFTKTGEGYSVRVAIWESGRSHLLVDKPVASVFEAEAAAQSFTAQHRIPWHTVEVLYR